VAGLTDTTGHLAQRYVYDVWGVVTRSSRGPQVGLQNKFGYTGEALDPGTSLYYLRARYYDPTLGRFLNKDPLAGFDVTPQSLNRFGYGTTGRLLRTELVCAVWTMVSAIVAFFFGPVRRRCRKRPDRTAAGLEPHVRASRNMNPDTNQSDLLTGPPYRRSLALLFCN
jgi:RHS repeat-associated protein